MWKSVRVHVVLYNYTHSDLFLQWKIFISIELYALWLTFKMKDLHFYTTIRTLTHFHFHLNLHMHLTFHESFPTVCSTLRVGKTWVLEFQKIYIWIIAKIRKLLRNLRLLDFNQSFATVCSSLKKQPFFSPLLARLVDVWLHFAVARSVLQRVAVWCSSALQCVAVCCSVLQCAAVRCSVLQCVSAVQCGPVRCSVLQCGVV